MHSNPPEKKKKVEKLTKEKRKWMEIEKFEGTIKIPRTEGNGIIPIGKWGI